MQSHNNPALRQELLDFTGNIFQEFAEQLPQDNYWGFAGYSVIAPEILSYFTTFSLPEADSLGPWWNDLDVILQGFTGVRQLFDKKNPSPRCHKKQGHHQSCQQYSVAHLNNTQRQYTGTDWLCGRRGHEFSFIAG